MTKSHPFDTALHGIDRAARRVTTTAIDALTDGQHLDITLIVQVPVLVVVDLQLFRAAEGRVRLALPPRLRHLPVTFEGFGVEDDGTVVTWGLGAEPCLCPASESGKEHWNPLTLGIVWHPGLSRKLGRIVPGFRRDILEHMDQYCPRGLVALTFALKEARQHADVARYN